jgi:hypothetical protein
VSGRLFVIGGTHAAACPPNADCIEAEEASRRDGASFDPGTERWAPIAHAPVPLGGASTAVVGDRIYMLLHGFGSSDPAERPAFVAYDVNDDAWSELTHPDPDGFVGLLPADGEVVAFQMSQEDGYRPDVIYVPHRDAWLELPRDPLTPSFDRWMLSTPRGLVVTGIKSVPQPGIDPSIYRAAIFTEGRWERLPDSEVVGYEPRWALLNGDVVNVSVGELDGGETNGWEHPYPIGGILDLQTLSWRDLPQPPFEGAPWEQPARGSTLTGVYADDGRRAIGGQGYVFDAERGRWYSLRHPAGAPQTEMAATWTDEGLVVWGGVRWFEHEHELSAGGWLWGVPN